MQNNKQSLKYIIADAINNISSSVDQYIKLEDIYNEVAKIIGKPRTANADARIRARLQENCSEYSSFLDNEDMFVTKEKGSGLWRNKYTSERDALPAIIDIVGLNPGIDMGQIIKIAFDQYKYKLTYVDKFPSTTRKGEIMFQQRIRNITSHRENYDKIFNFEEINDVFHLTLKSDTNNKKLKEEVVEEKVEKSFIFPSGNLFEIQNDKKNKKLYGTSKIGTAKTEKGRRGELYVLNYLLERDFNASDEADDATRPWDLSIETDKKIIGLEVKNLTNNNAFYLSDNEMEMIENGKIYLCLTDMNGIWISKQYFELKFIPSIIKSIREIKEECINKYNGKLLIDSIAINTSGLEEEFYLINNISNEQLKNKLI